MQRRRSANPRLSNQQTDDDDAAKTQQGGEQDPEADQEQSPQLVEHLDLVEPHPHLLSFPIRCRHIVVGHLVKCLNELVHRPLGQTHTSDHDVANPKRYNQLGPIVSAHSSTAAADAH